jgi:hypothetical protein
MERVGFGGSLEVTDIQSLILCKAVSDRLEASVKGTCPDDSFLCRYSKDFWFLDHGRWPRSFFEGEEIVNSTLLKAQ